MKKLFSALILVFASAQNANAAIIDIESMDVSFATITSIFLGGSINLDVVSSDNLLGGYISAITATPIGPAGIQTLYTAAANENPNNNPMAPADGTFPGGPVPTGIFNTDTGAITVDMSSLFANHGPMDQNLGGIATGFLNVGTGEYLMSWTAVLSQGPQAGRAATFTFGGTATVVPVPAAVWLFGSGLIGLVAVSRRKAA